MALTIVADSLSEKGFPFLLSIISLRFPPEQRSIPIRICDLYSLYCQLDKGHLLCEH